MTNATQNDMAASGRRPALPSWVIGRIESFGIPVLALIAGAMLFSLFLMTQGKSPLEFFALVWRAAFSSAFSWKNTLSHVSPLLMAALCVAIPARLGLMVIGGEGAIILGGLAAAVVGANCGSIPAFFGFAAMVVAAFVVGGVWIGTVGALRVKRGVNETISSLLMAYIATAIFNQLVESVFRDPASLNKPATMPIPDALRVTDLPFLSTHWGVPVGIVICIACYFLLERTTIGFAARVTGDNIRAAQVQGLPVSRLVIGFTGLAGGLAGVGGFFEVSAIYGNANDSLISGVGNTGILVAFLARHHPLAIIPVALLLGGFEASSGLVQRRMDLPDATILVFEGCIFILVLLSETLYGRSDSFIRKILFAGRSK